MLIYLASQSPRRREILKQMKIAFRVVPSSYQEKTLPLTLSLSPSGRGLGEGINPTDLAVEHALGKVIKAEVPLKARWVLGADTVVWAEGRILGKPRDAGEAVKMLKMISGASHEVVTGLALHDRKRRLCWVGWERTRVWVKKLSTKFMREYIDQIHSYDKAGAYAIQMKPRIVSKIQGSYSNVVGLPKILLRQMLRSR